ncbi:hypothetical protein AWH56_008555 [Anaerobacillus isosaccharinicus]|uniref:Uncharacterized protein n=1 Tax=Anaerobacillus isosaccharinicus TaxID=1532552 RepID=A0A1S2L2C0_9BACI|nr:hypothetical protein [Anaerobacillus isosaccharinicus]MBA5583965.1 hypothetical protein [Anaerobacillus isosaccharinicus]QOY37617.1 hypothetical protein AWH56_008555 [Anaerobacillus isosaccharinicus]
MLKLFKRKEEDKINENTLKPIIKNELITNLGLDRPFWNNEIPKKEIIEKADKMYESLELKKLHHCGIKVEEYFLTSRQMHKMEISLLYAVDGEINKAFHELADFILNYRDGIDEPISNFERFCIKQMLECIFYVNKE